MATLTFAQALLQAEAQARSTLDVALHERLAAAVCLARDGRVFQTSSGDWQVDSSSREGIAYTVNGVCSCDDHHYNHPPKGLCKHRLAMFLHQRAFTLMQQPAPMVPEVVEPWPDNDIEGPVEVPCDPPAPAPAPLPEAPAGAVVGVDPRFVVLIQGKPFVTFAGLLALAHQRGLQALRVQWTANEAELSLASATAVFAFGTFEECGDASPSNVTKNVAPHFRRVACTRAAARALRLALGVETCSLEELGQEE